MSGRSVRRVTGWLTGSVIVVAAGIGPLQAAEPVELRYFSPKQLIRGQQTSVTVRVPKKAIVTGAEVSPPEGVTVVNVKPLDQQPTDGMKRWTVTFEVDGAAAPGERFVALNTSLGATAAQEVLLPPHVPILSDFKVLRAEREPLGIDFSVVVTDAEGDLGDKPSIKISLWCGGYGLMSTAWPTVSPEGLMQVSVGDPVTNVKEGAVCDLELTVPDEKGYEGRLATPVRIEHQP